MSGEEPVRPASGGAGRSSDVGALLVSQAQAFTQAEEGRFIAAQSRAATLLGLAGVTAGIGAGIVAGLTDRTFAPPWLELIGLGAGLGALWFLLWSVALAVGVLQQSPGGSDPSAPSLRDAFDQQIAPNLSDPSETTQALLVLGAALRLEAKEAGDKADAAFAAAGRRLAISIFLVFVLAFVAYVWTEPTPQRFFLGAKGPPPPGRSATLGDMAARQQAHGFFEKTVEGLGNRAYRAAVSDVKSPGLASMLEPDLVRVLREFNGVSSEYDVPLGQVIIPARAGVPMAKAAGSGIVESRDGGYGLTLLGQSLASNTDAEGADAEPQEQASDPQAFGGPPAPMVG